MQVVPRPHRPLTPNVIPQDNTPVGKQDKKDGMPLLYNSVVAQLSLTSASLSGIFCEIALDIVACC